jgi:hypothetical protein
MKKLRRKLNLPCNLQFRRQNKEHKEGVETSPEILLVYRAHLVMIAHKISSADTLYKGAK